MPVSVPALTYWRLPLAPSRCLLPLDHGHAPVSKASLQSMAAVPVPLRTEIAAAMSPHPNLRSSYEPN